MALVEVAIDLKVGVRAIDHECHTLIPYLNEIQATIARGTESEERSSMFRRLARGMLYEWSHTFPSPSSYAGSGARKARQKSRLGIIYQAYQKLENPLTANPTVRTLEQGARAFGKRLELTLS